LIAQSPVTYVDYHRVRVDPRRAEAVDQVIAFDFGKAGKAGLHVRRGVAEFLPDPAKHYRPSDLRPAIEG